MEKKELPPVSYTREGIRVSASVLVSVVGTCFSLYFFFDDHWEHRDEAKEIHKSLEKKIIDEDAKALRQAYFLRMATLKDQINHLRMKRKVNPDQFLPIDAVTLESLEDQYQQIDRMYNTEQLKPK